MSEGRGPYRIHQLERVPGTSGEYWFTVSCGEYAARVNISSHDLIDPGYHEALRIAREQCIERIDQMALSVLWGR